MQILCQRPATTRRTPDEDGNEENVEEVKRSRTGYRTGSSARAVAAKGTHAEAINGALERARSL